MSLTIQLHSIKYFREGYDEVVIEEPYVLVTSVSLQRPILPNLVLPNIQVFPYSAWDDFDGDQAMLNSGASFWETESQPRYIANPDEVIFAVTLMQNDHGNPDQYPLVGIRRGRSIGRSDAGRAEQNRQSQAIAGRHSPGDRQCLRPSTV